MSGTLADLLARPVGIDVLTPLQKYATLGQTQAQTGLIQQQEQAAETANQLARLRLGIRVQGTAPFLNGAPAANGAGYLPGAPNGGGGGGGAAAAPVAQGALAGIAGDGGGGGNGGAGGGGAPQVSTALGFPAPAYLTAMVMSSENPAAESKTVLELRRTRSQELLSQPDWQQGVTQLYREGWMDEPHYRALVANPGVREQILRGLQSPDSYASTVLGYYGHGTQLNGQTGEPEVSPAAVASAGAKAAATAAGTASGELPYVGPRAEAGAAGTARGSGALVDVRVRNPDGSFSVQQVPPAQVQQFLQQNQGSQRATTADLSNPEIVVSPQAYVGRIVQAENAGGAADAKNPRSNATGDGQFIPTTWLATVKAAKPAWAQGMSDEQILAARGDRAKSAEMTYAHAQQNAPGLQAAGLPVNTMTLGLTHALGPGDIRKVMDADPGTPLRRLFSDAVMEANPQFARQTAGGLVGQAVAKYGMNRVDLSQPWNAAAAPVVAAGTVAGAGVPTLPPQAAAALDVTKSQIARDQTIVDKSLAGAQAAQQQQTNLTQLRDLGGQINSGSFGEARQGVQNYFATFAPEWGEKFVKAITLGKIDPSKAAATQEFVKIALQTASQAEKANNPQGGLGITQVYTSAFPNLETQPTAIRDMSNLFLINQQRTIDHAQGQQAYLSGQQGAFGDGGKYNSVQSFDADFLKTNGPRVYVGAAAALNGKPYAEWSRGLSPIQQQEALRVMWRADPTATVVGPDGKTYGKPAQ